MIYGRCLGPISNLYICFGVTKLQKQYTKNNGANENWCRPLVNSLEVIPGTGFF